jgi:hypothetical protein
MKHKKCSKCGIKKPLHDFYVDSNRPDDRKSSCKECNSIVSKRSYEESRDVPESVARRIIKNCKEREKERLARLIKRQEELDYLPQVDLTDKQFNIDIDWMLKQRDKQNNKCYYTGLEMIWSTGLIDGCRINPYAVTIERLDSSKGYVKRNCVLANWYSNCAKGSGTIEELVKFSAEIVKKYISDNLDK